MQAERGTSAEKLAKNFNDTNYFAQGTYKRDYVSLFTSSFLANIFTKTILAPLERWRIIKQTQNAYQLRPIKFSSFKHYLDSNNTTNSEGIKQQGTKALWRGNGANCWMHFWQIFFQIGIFDTFKSSFHEMSYEMQNNSVLKFCIDRIIAPFATAAVSLALIHPIDTARIRVTMNYHRQPKEMLFHGVTSSWSYIRLEQRSMKGLYRGYSLALLMSVIYLNIFTSFKNLYTQFKAQNSQIADLLLSKEAIGSTLALALLHPLDTIKKNYQLNNQGRPILFRGLKQVYQYTKATKGVMHLYQGFTVTIIRNLLFCPIFALSLRFMESNVVLFD